MIVYHGTVEEIRHPEVIYSKRYLDFGQGFYVTSYQRQAERWALRKAMRRSAIPVVNVYELSERWEDFEVLRFDRDDEAWLEFVCECRRGGERFRQYDLIIGSVADDDVFKTVDMYFRGAWDKERTLAELRYYRKNDQIALISQAAIDSLLTYQSSYQVEGENRDGT